jgi:hypothetical protein
MDKVVSGVHKVMRNFCEGEGNETG